MHADDVPTEVTKLVYTCPLSISKAVSQNQVAELLAHYWPAIEEHIREQVAQDMEAQVWPHESEARDDRIWERAALIARTGDRHRYV